MREAYRDKGSASAPSAQAADPVWQHVMHVAGQRQQRRRQSVQARERRPGPAAGMRAQPAPVSPSQREGAAAEARALALLQAAGLQAVAQNVRCRAGELDLVMLDGSTLVFVEVRSKRAAPSARGGALASITAGKRRRLCLAAAMFLQQWFRRTGQAPPCRFDVVAIDGASATWHRQAFQAGMARR